MGKPACRRYGECEALQTPTIALQLGLQTDRHVGVIHLEEENTVKSLRDKLQDSLSSGYADSGFPILRRDVLGMRVAGYIGVNELEHALGNELIYDLIIPSNAAF